MLRARGEDIQETDGKNGNHNEFLSEGKPQRDDEGDREEEREEVCRRNESDVVKTSQP
jgi:hypothetical protein